MKDIYSVIFLDDCAKSECKRLFTQACATWCTVFSDDDSELRILACDDPEDFLRQHTEGCFQLGNNTALLLDVSFEESHLLALQQTDHPCRPENKRLWGLYVLRTVKRIDPDFPVIVFTDCPESDLRFDAGQIGADDFLSKEDVQPCRAKAEGLAQEAYAGSAVLARVRQAIRRCRTRSVYDHEHAQVADDYAADYDTDERAKIATVAYYHFENETISTIVDEMLNQFSDTAGRRLRVLDLGCGTGRIGELLAQREDRGQIELVGVDFSGPMLSVAKKKFTRMARTVDLGFGVPVGTSSSDRLSLSFFRASAEELSFLGERYPEGFDFVVLGFGFLSYVRYAQVLPPCPPNSTRVGGVVRHIRVGGKLLFSVYNEESIAYSVVRRLDYENEEMSIAAFMDLSSGFLSIPGNRYIACDAFTIQRITRLIRQAGLVIDDVNHVWTFPTSHLTMKNTVAAQDAWPVDPDFSPGLFSPFLYEQDKMLSQASMSQGHYILGVAERKGEVF